MGIHNINEHKIMNNHIDTNIIQTRELINVEGEFYESEKQTYVAVSYVWSQVHEYGGLHNMVVKIHEYNKEKKIWIDQLSNLGKDSDSDTIIRNMNKIYANCLYVYAVIPELEIYDKVNINEQRLTFKYTEKQLEDIQKHVFVRILMSKWFTRAWTLQEQVSPSKIVTSVGKDIIDITTIVKYILYMQTDGLYKEMIIDGLYGKLKVKRIPTKNNYDNWTFDDIVQMSVYKQFKNDIGNSTIIEMFKSFGIFEIISMMTNRVMGELNKGFEPLQALIGNYDIQDLLDNSQGYVNPAIINRSSGVRVKQNKCWIPTRLNYEHEDIENDNIPWYIEDNGTIGYPAIGVRLNHTLKELLLPIGYKYYKTAACSEVKISNYVRCSYIEQLDINGYLIYNSHVVERYVMTSAQEAHDLNSALLIKYSEIASPDTFIKLE